MMNSLSSISLQIFSLYWIVAPAIIFPQSPAPKFEHLSLEQGLSGSIVTSIVQDRQGFMWFATYEGLDRFDGYNFLVFLNDPSDSASLSSNVLQKILISRDGTLWIATREEGLNRFDREKQRFQVFRHDPADSTSIRDNIIWSMCEDRDRILWIGTD